MKIKLQAALFQAALANCTGALGNVPNIPILSHIKVSSDIKRIKLVVSDVETTITTFVEAEFESNADFEFTMPAKKVSMIVAELDAKATITLDVEDNKVKMQSGKSRFKLLSLKASDFPVPTIGEELGSCTVNAQTFGKALDDTMPSSAVNDVRYYLNGIYLSFEADKSTLVATDGHRLSFNVIDISNSNLETNFIVPRKTATLVRKLAKTGAEIRLAKHASMVHFIIGDVSIVSKLIDGQFPDWKRVVPQNKIHADVDVDALQVALRRSLIVLADQKSKGITMTFTQENLTVHARSAEDSNEADDELVVDYDGGECVITVNPAYVSDALSSVGENSTFLLPDSQQSPFVVRPKGAEYPCHVVMPMRV